MNDSISYIFKLFQWQSIGELNKLPQLEDFRFLKNPILETETYETSIQLVIARIANLKVRMYTDYLLRII